MTGEPIRLFYVSTENPVCEVVYPALLYIGADESMLRFRKKVKAILYYARKI